MFQMYSLWKKDCRKENGILNGKFDLYIVGILSVNLVFVTNVEIVPR